MLRTLLITTMQFILNLHEFKISLFFKKEIKLKTYSHIKKVQMY